MDDARLRKEQAAKVRYYAITFDPKLGYELLVIDATSIHIISDALVATREDGRQTYIRGWQICSEVREENREMAARAVAKMQAHADARFPHQAGIYANEGDRG